MKRLQFQALSLFCGCQLMIFFFAAETHHEHFVNFEEYDDEPTTCSSENQGQLTYRKDEGNLEMCEGAKWTRLATSNKEDFLKNLFWKIFFSAKS